MLTPQIQFMFSSMEKRALMLAMEEVDPNVRTTKRRN
jgi:hypothetical protein